MKGTTMDKIIFASRLATKIRATEHAIDGAIAAASELAAEMATGRIQAGFAAQAGHKALVNILEAVGALGEARTRMIASHDRLAIDARRMGIEVEMAGPWERKPATGLAASDAPPLRAVG